MILKIAEPAHLNTLEHLYQKCIDDLNSRGIYQWDHKYPNRETHKTAIAAEEQFLILDGDNLIGGVIMNETQADEWAAVDWKITGTTPLVIHALVLSPSEQGKGYGRKILSACEDHARKRGYACMRLDVFPENPVALALYEKSGFLKRGKVRFDYKPEGHREYHCYEKQL